MQHALTLSRDAVITPRDLSARIRDAPPRPSENAIAISESIDEEQLAWCDELGFMKARQTMQERFEKAYLTRLLKFAAAKVSESARRSGLDRSNLRRIMTRHGIRAEDIARREDG